MSKRAPKQPETWQLEGKDHLLDPLVDPILGYALNEADALRTPWLTSVHLLIGLFDAHPDLAELVVSRGVTRGALRAVIPRLAKEEAERDKLYWDVPDDIPTTEHARAVWYRVNVLAEADKQPRPEHLLLGIVDHPHCSAAGLALAELGVSRDELVAAVTERIRLAPEN